VVTGVQTCALPIYFGQKDVENDSPDVNRSVYAKSARNKNGVEKIPGYGRVASGNQDLEQPLGNLR